VVRDSRKAIGEEGFEWRADLIEAEIRTRIRSLIEGIVAEELETALGAGKSQRVGAARNGYRHGSRARQLTTSLGPTTITMPRARLQDADGQESEWHSRVVRRYQRRTERVDGAILGLYLSGINSRRLRGALAPLLRGAPLSKDAVSRLVGRMREELAEDYRRMIYADSRDAVRNAHPGFVRKWRLRCKAVVSSLEEAGEELFTFLQFPKLQWKALRTTNALERINEEFRRRTKTQASLPTEDAVLLLLFGLLRSGQIVLRRMDGWHDIPKVIVKSQAA
jgi:transposase-like protein